MSVTWEQLNRYERQILKRIYNTPGRIAYSDGAYSNSLRFKGLLISEGKGKFSVSAWGCDVYERAHPQLVTAAQPPAADAGGAGKLTAFPISDDGMVSVSAKAYRALERELATLKDDMAFAASELAQIPAPIEDTRYATEMINSAYATLTERVPDQVATEQRVRELEQALASERAARERAEAALRIALAALKRGKPQISGVLVIQDFERAINKAADALASGQGEA